LLNDRWRLSPSFLPSREADLKSRASEESNVSIVSCGTNPSFAPLPGTS
jgi:hypothetical protein